MINQIRKLKFNLIFIKIEISILLFSLSSPLSSYCLFLPWWFHALRLGTIFGATRPSLFNTYHLFQHRSGLFGTEWLSSTRSSLSVNCFRDFVFSYELYCVPKSDLSLNIYIYFLILWLDNGGPKMISLSLIMWPMVANY